MIVVTCLPCALAIRVMPQRAGQQVEIRELRELVGDRSDFWPNRFPCPSCGKLCPGLMEELVDERAYALLKLRDLTPIEAFAAFNGMGFPEEQQCSMATLHELFKEQPVRRIVGSDVDGQARAVLDTIELWDGTRVHFGASPAGAVVYRIVRPPSLATKVEDKPGEDVHG